MKIEIRKDIILLARKAEDMLNSITNEPNIFEGEEFDRLMNTLGHYITMKVATADRAKHYAGVLAEAKAQTGESDG